MDASIPLLVITGPTATGKTALAIELAEVLGGEIITADSMQVYRGMDIGTAKPTLSERRGIPHHLIDIVDVWESFSVADYCEMAHKVIREVHERGNLPILAGGTGLYIKAVVENIRFSKAEKDESFRAELHALAAEKGNEAVYKILMEKDRAAAERIKPNDLKRIVRALEVLRQTGKSITEHDEASRNTPKIYKNVILGLELERSILYNRINERVMEMLSAGLVDEVRNVLVRADEKATSLQAIGYKEIVSYLRGETTLEEATEQLKRATRHYAKRQMTWLRGMEGIHWIDASRSRGEIVKEALRIAREVLGGGQA